MATIWVQDEPSGLVSGLRIGSDVAAASAAVIQGLVEAIAQPTDVLTSWALHPYEQDGTREVAYANERRELGDAATVYVEELTRPRQQNVVWVDRYHLIASGCTPRSTHRLCGLYVAGDGGQCVCMIHDPSVSHMMHEHARAIAHSATAGWDDEHVAMSCRLVVRTGSEPHQVQVRLPAMFVPTAHTVIEHTRARIAGG